VYFKSVFSFSYILIEGGRTNFAGAMSFLKSKTVVEEGDVVILYLSVSSQYPIEVTKFTKNRNGQLVENKFQTIYGALDVMTLVGKRYGSKLNLPWGWGYILSPTCELWTKNLPHRTQIIYTPDISLILMGLNLSPGSIVIEAGMTSSVNINCKVTLYMNCKVFEIWMLFLVVRYWKWVSLSCACKNCLSYGSSLHL